MLYTFKKGNGVINIDAFNEFLTKIDCPSQRTYRGSIKLDKETLPQLKPEIK